MSELLDFIAEFSSFLTILGKIISVTIPKYNRLKKARVDNLTK